MTAMVAKAREKTTQRATVWRGREAGAGAGIAAAGLAGLAGIRGRSVAVLRVPVWNLRGNAGGELIAAARNGDDVAGAVPKSFTEQRNVLGKVVFFDERFRPDGLEELVFCDHAAGIADQAGEHLKGLWQERDGLAVAQQGAPGAAQFELVELV
jgi:hypothetical protein